MPKKSYNIEETTIDNENDDNYEDNISDNNDEDDNEDNYDNDEIDDNEDDNDNDNGLEEINEDDLNDIYNDENIEYTENELLSNNNIVQKENKISINRLTKYEMVRILGERTKQLLMGAKPLIKNYNHLTYEEMAEEELRLNMIPFKIKRPLPNGKYEIWTIEELNKDHLIF